MSALQVKIVYPLDAFQLLILFVGTMMYLKPNFFLNQQFYNSNRLIIVILIAFKMDLRVYCLYPRIG
jgi:hypothetical protein